VECMMMDDTYTRVHVIDSVTAERCLFLIQSMTSSPIDRLDE